MRISLNQQGNSVCITIEDDAWLSTKTEAEWNLLFSRLFEKTVQNSRLSVNLLLTNDDQIRKINRKHRNIDKATNILSFPYYSPKELNLISLARSSVSERSEQAYTPTFSFSPYNSIFPFWNEKRRTRLRGIWSRWRAKRTLTKYSPSNRYNGVHPKRKDTMATSKMLDFIRTSIKQTLTKSVWQSAQLNSSKKKERAILPIYENMLLGDVVMSYNTVLNEASLFRKSFDARVSHLFVHGLLHILGYDHVSEQDRHEMETLETKILSTCDIENPYTSSL